LSGPTLGGTVVGVSGIAFMPSLLLRCRFGTTEVLGIFVSSTLVNCSAPPGQVGESTVEISINGASYTNAQITYRYLSEVAVVALQPRVGPIHGGTNVSVIGANLPYGSTCRFCDQPAVHFQWVTPFELRCTSPPHYTSGFCAVEVSSNTQEWTTNRIEFAYVSEPTIERLSPLIGPEHGGTLVELSVRDCEASMAVPSCRFGTHRPVAARWLSIGLLSCRSPPGTAGVNVSVSLSVNGQQYVGVHRLYFEYQHEMEVLSLEPSSGPSGGGTMVVVRGRHFSARAAHLGLVSCVFISGNASLEAFSTVVALLVSSAEVRCISPSHPAGPFRVAVCTGHADNTALSNVIFRFNHMVAEKISPTHGTHSLFLNSL